MCIRDSRTADGVALWKKTVEVGPYRTHKMNNTAAATPAVDQNMVVFSWYESGRKSAMLSAYSHEGRHLWDFEIGSFKGAHGTNIVPVIHDGSVIFAHLHQLGGYVASINGCLLYTSPSPRDKRQSRMPSSA